MGDQLQARIKELDIILDQARAEIEKLTNQINAKKREEWVGFCFKVEREHFLWGERVVNRSVSFYQIVEFAYWYYSLQVERIEYKDGERIVRINSHAIVDPEWLAAYGEELSRSAFRVEVEYLLRCALPWRVGLPPRPAVETMCPCPGCWKCCCGWVEGLDEENCVNFEEFGRCICEHSTVPAEGHGGRNNLIVLWHGVEEYEEFPGTLEEAISYVNRNRRWDNYGQTGTAIIRAKKLYEIKKHEIKNEILEYTAEEYQEAVATDEEVEAAIKKYEQQFGMSSEEFLEQVRLGTAPDEAGIIDWKLLLKYR